MPSKLRRRLFCHYCGQRSKFQLTHKEGRKFKCENCEAVNFLDENGDIADVPPDETAEDVQYARAGSTVRPSPTAQSSIFCTTCLKNQALLTEALSNYLPESADARYYARLPDHKKELEERYPQCCTDCEPRVRQQLQQATYIAKSDHIRRMLERSRRRRIASGWGWRSLVVRLGGLCYGLSLIAQLAWHSAGALKGDGFLTSSDISISPHWQCLTGRQISTGCASSLGDTVGPALVLGLLSVWWNPKWQHKLAGTEGRLKGLQEYYQTQAVLLVVRFVSWIMLYGAEDGALSILQRPLHSVSLVLESIITVWSMFSIISIDTTPPVNWQQDPAPLISHRQFVPPSRPDLQPFSPPNSKPEPTASSHFSIDNLTSSRGSQQQIWHPPTPLEDDVDMMDLDHNTASFQLVQKSQQIKSHSPTPFHGTLPAIPTNRLLHPKPETLPKSRQAIGIPPGFFDRPAGPVAESKESIRGTLFAEPRLFPNDAKIDTGLEKIFGTVFSLREEPVEIEDIQMQDPPPSNGDIFEVKTTTITANHGPILAPWSATNFIALLFAFGLFLGISFLLVEEYLACPFPSARLAINIFGACIPGTHLLQRLRYSSQRSTDRIILLIGFTILAILGWSKSQFDVMSDKAHTKFLVALLAIMIYPEAYLVFQRDNENLARHSRNEVFSKPPIVEALQMPASPPSYTPSVSKPSWGQSARTWSDQGSQLLSRPRTNSMDSGVSIASAATTSSTASGWKTPKPSNSRFFDVQQTPGYASGFSRLALEDGPVGNSIARPRDGAYGERRR